MGDPLEDEINLEMIEQTKVAATVELQRVLDSRVDERARLFASRTWCIKQVGNP